MTQLCSLYLELMLTKTKTAVFANDEMIENSDIYGAGGFGYSASEALVFWRRFGMAAGMVVHQDQANGVMGQSCLDNSSGIDDGVIYGAFVNDFVLDDFVLGVEIDDHKRFVGEASEFGASEVYDGLGGGERVLAFHPFCKISYAQFFDKSDECGRDGAQPCSLFEFTLTGIQDAGEPAEVIQQGFGDGFHILAGKGVCEQKFKQFVVVESFGSDFLEFLSQALVVAKIVGLVGHIESCRPVVEIVAIVSSMAWRTAL